MLGGAPSRKYGIDTKNTLSIKFSLRKVYYSNGFQVLAQALKVIAVTNPALAAGWVWGC